MVLLVLMVPLVLMVLLVLKVPLVPLVLMVPLVFVVLLGGGGGGRPGYVSPRRHVSPQNNLAKSLNLRACRVLQLLLALGC